MGERKCQKTKKRLLAAAIAVCVLLLRWRLRPRCISTVKWRLSAARQRLRQDTGSGGTEDGMLSFSGLDLDDIDVMENGGTIEPPQGDVNMHGDITHILPIIGSDEREEGQTARAEQHDACLCQQPRKYMEAGFF